MRALDDALPAGVALIVAPVGSGKTTLLEQWASQRARPVQWIGASAPRGVRALSPGAGTPSGPSGSRTVVIDDAHTIGPDDIEVVQHFIERTTPQATVLVASRTVPAFNLAHREFPRPVLLTGEDLRFRPREIAQLFRDVYGTWTTPAAAAELGRETDGWAAALHLHHLAQGSRPGRPTFATEATRTTNDLLLQDYLTREVLRPLPPLLVHFLRVTSVFDTVTPSRCDELLGWTGSRQALLELSRREGLVRRDPTDGEAYRYNAVLRDHLRMELHEQIGTAGVLTLQALAADVLTRASDPREEAIARARARDWSGLSALVRAHGERLTRPGTAAWLDLLPPSVRDANAWFLLASSRTLLADGRVADAGDAARRAAADMGDDDGSRLCEEMIAEVARWTPSGSGAADLLAAWAAEPDGATLLTAALAVLVDAADPAETLDPLHSQSHHDGQTWMARLALAIGLTRDGSGQGAEAVLRLATERRAVGDAAGAFLLECAVALAGFRLGRPDVALLERLSISARDLGSVSAIAWLSSGLALAAANADLPEAILAAETAEAVARAAGVAGAHAMAYAALAIVKPGSRSDLLELARDLSAAPAVPGAGVGADVAVSAGAAPAGDAPSRSIRPWEWLTGHAEQLREPAPTVIAPASARDIDVQCLGTFRLSIHADEIDLSGVRPVARTVLRALAIRAGTPVHRDWLVEQFWPTRRPAASIHNLHVAISALRKALEARVPGQSHALLARDGDTYVFAPGRSLVTDIQRVLAQLRVARELGREGDRAGQATALRSVLELYAADVLPEDGPAEWVVETRDHCRISVARAATRLADLELRAGNASAAIVAAERAVELDVWNDAAWRALVTAHTRAHDRVAAERARHHYHRLLESLGVDEPGSPDRPGLAGRVIPLDPLQERLKKATSPTASLRFGAAP